MNIILQSKMFRVLLVLSFLRVACTEVSISNLKSGHISNVRHAQHDSAVVIQYDLTQEMSGSRYEVQLVMLKSSDTDFRYIPKQLDGDIGGNIDAGIGKTVTWNTKTEFPEGLDLGDYYFRFQAREEEESSISPWVWVAGAVVVGGVIFLVANKEKKEEIPAEFPTPPGRP